MQILKIYNHSLQGKSEMTSTRDNLVLSATPCSPAPVWTSGGVPFPAGLGRCGPLRPACVSGL